MILQVLLIYVYGDKMFNIMAVVLIMVAMSVLILIVLDQTHSRIQKHGQIQFKWMDMNVFSHAAFLR